MNRLISVSDLMQITHPGHLHYTRDEDVLEKDFPLFLDYVVHVYDRFKHYAEQQENGRLSDRSLYAIIDCMKQLNETDEPSEVYPLRDSLKNYVLEFEVVCDSMSRCFTSPLIVNSFYSRLGVRVGQQVLKYAGAE